MNMNKSTYTTDINMSTECTTSLEDRTIIEHLKKLEDESNEKLEYYTIIDFDIEYIKDHPLRGVFFLSKTKFGAFLALYDYMVSRNVTCYYGPKRNKVPQSICDLIPDGRPKSLNELIADIECFSDESFATFPKVLVIPPK